jgi:hypothetical protein
MVEHETVVAAAVYGVPLLANPRSRLPSLGCQARGARKEGANGARLAYQDSEDTQLISSYAAGVVGVDQHL